MDYLGIVLNGYINNREYLEKYFYREFKKAEKESYFEFDEFFNGCMNVVTSLEKELENQIFERKKDLYTLLGAAKNKTLTHENMGGKSVEENNEETIKYCYQELRDVRPDGVGDLTFTVNLLHFSSSKFIGHLKYSEILYIKEKISKAYEQELNILTQNSNSNVKETKVKGFESYFEINEPQQFLDELIDEFTEEEKGKNFSFLFHCLMEKKILKLSGRKSKFYSGFREHLNINIGSDASLNKYLIFANDKSYQSDLTMIKDRLEIVLEKHNKNIKTS